MKSFIIICISTLFYSAFAQSGDRIRILSLVKFLEKEIAVLHFRARWPRERLCGLGLESWHGSLLLISPVTLDIT